MVNTLQMIEYLPLLDINPPSLLLDIFNDLSISSFNLIPFDTIFADTGANDPAGPYSDSFNNAGYSYSKILMNIPDIFILFIVMTLLLILFLTMRCLLKKFPK
jgi:hypothetical protein